MTLLQAILKLKKDKGLKTCNGINICQLIIDKDIKVDAITQGFVEVFKDKIKQKGYDKIYN